MSMTDIPYEPIKSRTLHVRLAPHVLEALRTHAAQERRSMAGAAALLLERALCPPPCPGPDQYAYRIPPGHKLVERDGCIIAVPREVQPE